MADSKISALTELTGANVEIAADVLPIVDDSVTTTKKVKVNNLLGAAYTASGDIVQASGAGVAAKLAIGTARQVPMVNAGATALAYQNQITLGTMAASTSGTTVDFTGLPAGVRRITVMFKGVSTNGTSPLIVQLGDSGGIETSGYLGAGSDVSSGAATGNFTTGLPIEGNSSAATSRHGQMVISLMDAATFLWVSSSVTGHSESGNSNFGAGSKALSAELTQIRITTVNGTDAFDAGSINISYE